MPFAFLVTHEEDRVGGQDPIVLARMIPKALRLGLSEGERKSLPEAWKRVLDDLENFFEKSDFNEGFYLERFRDDGSGRAWYDLPRHD